MTICRFSCLYTGIKNIRFLFPKDLLKGLFSVLRPDPITYRVQLQQAIFYPRTLAPGAKQKLSSFDVMIR